jgi:type IV secretory pathway TrbD component
LAGPHLVDSACANERTSGIAVFYIGREQKQDNKLAICDSGVPWGCLLFVIGAVILLLRLWLVAIGVFVLWAVCMFVRSRIRESDARYREIAKRIGEHEERFPELIFALRQLDDSTDLEGGWHDVG